MSESDSTQLIISTCRDLGSTTSDWRGVFSNDELVCDPVAVDDDAKAMMTPLMLAAEAGHVKLLTWLLYQGAPWNAVDGQGLCAGDLAMRDMKVSSSCYEQLINHACRAELLLTAVGKSSQLQHTQEQLLQKQTEQKHKSDAPALDAPDGQDASSLAYLQMPLTFSSDGKMILDHEGHGVMMDWEKPLMDLHAALICSKGSGDILNVGFGLGIIDAAIQAAKPRTHTIIEAHPDVYKKMMDDGWGEKPGVRVVFGRWQDVIHELGVCYDGIFFDTYGEFYKDLQEWHEHVPNLLKEDGIYSFFNGLGASTNAFFHEVYTELVQLELAEMTLQTTYVDVDIGVEANIWNGVNRPYWVLTKYHLPICRFFGEDRAQHEQETTRLVKLIQDQQELKIGGSTATYS